MILAVSLHLHEESTHDRAVVCKAYREGKGLVRSQIKFSITAVSRHLYSTKRVRTTAL
jgi:hypothetical protein